MPDGIVRVEEIKGETLAAPITPKLLKIPKYRTFGPLLKELRLSRGLTLEAVAKAVRTHKGYISGIENQKVAPPSPKFISKFARFFRVDEKDLLLLAYAEKAPKLIRDHVIQALWPEVPPVKDNGTS